MSSAILMMHIEKIFLLHYLCKYVFILFMIIHIKTNNYL